MIMAEETTTLGATKRFGARYGRTVKQRFIEVEQLHRQYYKCRYCTKEAVKRKVAGIWECKACHAQFTGKAYTPSNLKMSQITGKEGLEQDLLAPREKEENYNEDEQHKSESSEHTNSKKKKRKSPQEEEMEQEMNAAKESENFGEEEEQNADKQQESQ